MDRSGTQRGAQRTLSTLAWLVPFRYDGLGGLLPNDLLRGKIEFDGSEGSFPSWAHCCQPEPFATLGFRTKGHRPTRKDTRGVEPEVEDMYTVDPEHGQPTTARTPSPEPVTRHAEYIPRTSLWEFAGTLAFPAPNGDLGPLGVIADHGAFVRINHAGCRFPCEGNLIAFAQANRMLGERIECERRNGRWSGGRVARTDAHDSDPNQRTQHKTPQRTGTATTTSPSSSRPAGLGAPRKCRPGTSPPSVLGQGPYEIFLALTPSPSSFPFSTAGTPSSIQIGAGASMR